MKRIIFLLSIVLFLGSILSCSKREPSIKVYANYYNSILNSDYKSVRRYLRKYPVLLNWEFNYAGYQGDSLITAIAADDPDMFKLLLDAGAYPDYYTDEGFTPLMIVIEQGNIKILKYLLDADPDITLSNYNGSTALHYLAQFGTEEMGDLLFPIIENIDPLNDNLFTPLSFAISSYNFEMAQRFIDEGADLSITAENDPEIIVQCVIGHGNQFFYQFWNAGLVDPSIKDQAKNSLFHFAAMFKNHEIIQFLINNGYWDNSENEDGETPYDIAIHMGDLETIKVFEDSGLLEP